MSFDLDAALRTFKPEKRLTQLKRRADDALPWADGRLLPEGRLLLDTSVYIDIAQLKAPETVERLVESRLCDHSSVCLSELTHVFGRLDPSHSMTKNALGNVEGMIRDIPMHRLYEPDAGMWGEAGMIAGLLVRLTGASGGQGNERQFLNDALIYLQARALGISVLTRNIRDFDFLNQLIPDGRIVLYRQIMH